MSNSASLNAAIFAALVGNTEEEAIRKALGLKPGAKLPKLSDVEIALIRSDPDVAAARRRDEARAGAVDAINDFTRVKLREEGFYRRILPPLQISNDELDRCVMTDKPVKVLDP